MSAGKEIKWADVKTPAIAVPLTLENVDKKTLTDVAVDVTRFSGSGRMADALVDGKSFGATPCEVKGLAEGKHTIKLVPPAESGLAEWSKEIEVRAYCRA